MSATWEIVKELIEQNPNGKSPKQIAAFLGVSIALVYKWAQDPEASGSPISLGHAMRLSLYTGDHRLINYFAEELGGVFIPLNPKKTNIKDCTKALLKLIKEFGELASDSSAALSDGKLTGREKLRIHKGAHELVQLALMFDEVIHNG
jgi:hypothetical protein